MQAKAYYMLPSERDILWLERFTYDQKDENFIRMNHVYSPQQTKFPFLQSFGQERSILHGNHNDFRFFSDIRSGIVQL